MHEFFRYKMTESYAKEIKLPFPKLKSFIWEVQSKGGEILSLNELYARDQKLGNEIILVRIMKLRVFEMLKIIFGSKI